MADNNNKRQGNAGKAPVATPKSPPSVPLSSAGTPSSGMVSTEMALNAIVGVRVRLFTTISTYPQLEGVIDFIDPKQHLLAFVSRGPQPTHHIIAISALKDFELLPNNAFPLPTLLAPGVPPQINTKAVMARANEALAKAKEKAAKQNPTVSKEAQEIFDAIGRQFATRWEGKDIVVMDHVTVKGPGYRMEDCKAGKDAPQGTLARVKKVLENERKRLGQKDPAVKGPKPVIPAIPAIPAFSGGPRKGG